MNLLHFEYFLRVSELGSINRAATNLRLSQPALSRHIASLEHEMGTLLFARTQGGVNLTDAGKLLAQRIRPLLRQFTVLREEVGEQAAGQLSIGTPSAWQVLFTAPFIETLAREHPGVRLRLHEGLSNVLRDYMSAGQLDIGIVPFSTATMTGYSQTPILREPLVLVGRKEDNLSPDRAIPLSNLQGMNLTLPARPNVLRTQIEHAMERQGLRLRLVVEADTLATNLEMARRGVALTVLPASALFGEERSDSVSWTQLRGQHVTWALWENEARTHSQSVREGRKIILSTLSAVLDQNSWWMAERLAGLTESPI